MHLWTLPQNRHRHVCQCALYTVLFWRSSNFSIWLLFNTKPFLWHAARKRDPRPIVETNLQDGHCLKLVSFTQWNAFEMSPSTLIRFWLRSICAGANTFRRAVRDGMEEIMSCHNISQHGYQNNGPLGDYALLRNKGGTMHHFKGCSQTILNPPTELQKIVGFLLIFWAFQSLAPFTGVDPFKGFGSQKTLKVLVCFGPSFEFQIIRTERINELIVEEWVLLRPDALASRVGETMWSFCFAEYVNPDSPPWLRKLQAKAG